MVLGSLCGPSILYLGFSIIQIIIDIYKGLYNTSFIKFIVMILFTLFLNILCNSGLTVVSWLIVFIPFISMTVITTLLLFVFGLDPSRGTSNNRIIVTPRLTGAWRVVYPNGSFEVVTVTDGRFTMLGQAFELINTDPVTFRLVDGTVYRVIQVEDDGTIKWITDNDNTQLKEIIWIPLDVTSNPRDTIDPCPPGVSPEQFRSYFGGFCMTGTQLNRLRSTSSGTFRVIYFDGSTEIIRLTNGTYLIDDITYRLENTNPLRILWPNGVIQTIDTIGRNFIRWRTTSDDGKFRFIIWEPIDGGLMGTTND